MKRLYIYLIVLLCSGAHLQAQNITFEYDDSGNCIKKYKTIVLQNTQRNIVPVDTIQTSPEKGTLGKYDVFIYPNPTEGFLKVELVGDFGNTLNVQVTVMDINGRSINQLTCANYLFWVDMSSYVSGNYLLKLCIGQACETWKIIKQ